MRKILKSTIVKDFIIEAIRNNPNLTISNIKTSHIAQRCDQFNIDKRYASNILSLLRQGETPKPKQQSLSQVSDKQLRAALDNPKIRGMILKELTPPAAPSEELNYPVVVMMTKSNKKKLLRVQKEKGLSSQREVMTKAFEAFYK